ncbi:hypothetical protein [Candidatus Villigracilis affinis]|uniref:hypothetical protein n=1 Tax=Candidatus Villigracilis affinis TaxID=3140682 RepID=UPI002A216BCE|nr:hypothetical protein [Anaerolineales bacterium]
MKKTRLFNCPWDEEAKQSYISDDNQKVVFRGRTNIYSVNSDGSQKQVIVQGMENSLKRDKHLH